MSVRERVARDKVASEHVCQFFDSDESRAEAVAAFLAEGLRTDEHVIVVARPVHWAAISERLQGAGIPLRRRTEQGRLVVKDAIETLHRLSRGHILNQAAFDEHVGAAVRRLTALGRLRAYGEMVDVLAQRGEMTDVLRLEELWNRLGERVPFSLMCGYSAAHFVNTATHESLRKICQAHSDVRHHDQDALANWLLTSAHNGIGSSHFLCH